MFKKVFFLVAATLAFTACQPDQQLKNEIEQLEAEAGESPSPEQAEALIAAYDSFTVTFPAKHETISHYLFREAGLYYRMRAYSQSIEALETAIRDHHQGSQTAENALFLGTIFEEVLSNPRTANTIFAAGLTAFPDHQGLQEKWDDSSNTLTYLLEDYKETLLGPTGRNTASSASQFIRARYYAAIIAQEHPLAVDYLMEAGEVAMGAGAFTKALELYDLLLDRHSGAPQAEQALFLKAFCLDEGLKDFEAAGVAYAAFLKKYPKSEFADDAQTLLENLGKAPEELIPGGN